jgi:hypothetical protein
MIPTLSGLVLGFVVLLAVFRLIELARPCARRLPLCRRALLTDLACFVHPRSSPARLRVSA